VEKKCHIGVHFIRRKCYEIEYAELIFHLLYLFWIEKLFDVNLLVCWSFQIFEFLTNILFPLELGLQSIYRCCINRSRECKFFLQLVSIWGYLIIKSVFLFDMIDITFDFPDDFSENSWWFILPRVLPCHLII
jgi:hypothetical protein